MMLPGAVLERAAAHHGVVRRSDLRTQGLSDRQVERLVRSSQLVRMHAGVYRLAGAPRSWLQRQLAACYTTSGVSSHRAALRLWNLDVVLDDDSWPAEVTVAAGRRPRPAGVVVHRSLDLDEAATVIRQGVPVTTPQRMLVDLGAVVPIPVLRRAVEQAVASRLVSVATVRRELARLAVTGRAGVGHLRQVLQDWPVGDRAPDSVLELAFARLCRRAGLPAPRFQYEVVVGGKVRRIDFAYPEPRVAIEVDGFGCRTDRHVFQDERSRQNHLVQAGWRVARFTWEDVTRRPDHVVVTVRALLEAGLRTGTPA